MNINAIAGEYPRGTKPLDSMLNLVNKSMGIITEKLSNRHEEENNKLRKENARLRGALKQANAQLFRFGQVFDRFANKKLSEEINNEIDAEKILIRLTRNLKNSYVQSYAYDMAMRCINMTLALEPISSEEIRDKGILEERLLNHDEALTCLNQYLEISPNADDADFVLDLIKSIREKINQR